MAEPDDGWLTQSELAELMGRSPRTIRRWAKSGRIPTVDVAGVRRIHLSQVRKNIPAVYECLADEEQDKSGQ